MEGKCREYLKVLCEQIAERPVGSPGNQRANDYFESVVTSLGWKVASTSFPAMDWKSGGAELVSEGISFQVTPSPYSRGCEISAPLVSAKTKEELHNLDPTGKILLLSDELAREQLMPKNFVFYNPEEHREIIALLEQKEPAAILSATSRNAALAGGVYPFPLIEDGDFEIPSVYLTEDEGHRVLDHLGKTFHLKSNAQRFLGQSENLIASKGTDGSQRYAVSAHIDAKIGTPGAIDNATGVIILLLLAEVLEDYTGGPVIELLPFNGEDYYAASGQMLYLHQNVGKWDTVKLNINIDGAGYYQGPSALSLLEVPDEISLIAREMLNDSPEIVEGGPWYQGDHSIFLQQGVPAIAATSLWFLENIETQEVTHTPADHPGIVDCKKITDLADFISNLLLALTR